MAVYKFRVVFEEDEDIFREIEIKSTQNFEELHYCITNAINFTGDHDASFYISDDYWRKGEEIALRVSKESSKRSMSKQKIVALIDDPHQKFLYVYDPERLWTLMVELIKIVPDVANATYPKCVKSEGIAPKNIIVPIVDPDLLDEDFDDEDFDDEPPVDDAAYENAHDEEEVALLEGEEGEFQEEEEETNE